MHTPTHLDPDLPCPLGTQYITKLAHLPQSVAGSCAYANMARSQCIGCYYKQPHVCNDSEPTLYSPDAISLTGLKLQDQSPAVGDIPEPSAEDEPQLNLDSIPREEPPVNSATPKSPFRLCVVLDREPSVRSGEPKPRPAPRLSPRSELFKSKARSARSTPGSFPYEWPETWEWHPTTPGLLWIWRPWTDGEFSHEPV